MSDQEFKVVETDSIKTEGGAQELMSAPEMQPYLRYIEAAMLEKNTGRRHDEKAQHQYSPEPPSVAREQRERSAVLAESNSYLELCRYYTGDARTRVS